MHSTSAQYSPIQPINEAWVPVEQTLDEALAAVALTFKERTLLRQPVGAAEVLRYYRQCDRVYRRYHSHDGALHVGLVPPGTERPVQHGHTRQAELFGEMVKEIRGDRAIEFGCGTGYNIRLLAQLYPQCEWHGFDLSPQHVRTAIELTKSPNVAFEVGDYLRLDLPDGSYDAILAIETLCQCESQERALREAYRLLRGGGRMMVIDCFRACSLDQIPRNLAKASVLVERSAAVDQFAEIAPWEAMARQIGFDVIELADRSIETGHDLTRLYRMARRFFKMSPMARRLSRRIAPRALQNVICGLLMPYTVGQGVHRYLSIVLAKPL